MEGKLIREREKRENSISLEQLKNKRRRKMIQEMLDYCCENNDDLAFTFFDWLRDNLHLTGNDSYSALKFKGHEYKYEYFNGYSWGAVSEFHNYMLD